MKYPSLIAWSSGLLIALALSFPLWILGEHAVIDPHDNLEPIIALHAFLGENPEFRGLTLPMMLGGLPAAAYAPEPWVVNELYARLPTLSAYALNVTLQRLVAFAGAFMLFGFLAPENRLLRWLAAVGFAALPFWPPGGVSVAGTPAVAAAILYLSRRKTAFRQPGAAISLATLFLFPFYSLLANVGIFLILLVSGWIATLTLRRRRLPLPLVVGAVLLVGGYAIDNGALIVSTFGPERIEWHRTEFQSTLTSSQVQSRAVGLLQKSHYHADAKPFPLLWLLLVATPLLLGLRRFTSRSIHLSDPELRPPLLRLFLGGMLILALPLLYFLVYEPEKLNLRDRVPGLAQFNFARFYFLLPLLWSVTTLSASQVLWRILPPARIPVALLLALQIVFLARDPDWHFARGEARRQMPDFKTYVSRDLFDEAERRIGRPREDIRIACVGFFPSQAHFNGFRTVGGYWYLYPLERKHRVLDVIEDELAKDESLSSYFMDWGSRCYFVSAQLGRQLPVYRDEPRAGEPIELAYDIPALRRAGADFLFSAVPIGNSDALGLSPLGSITGAGGSINLHLYELPAEGGAR